MPGPTTLSETAKFRLEMELDGAAATMTVIVRPIGVLDEDVNFLILTQAFQGLGVPVKNVIFDLGHVARINSCGVREWILFLEKLAGTVTLSFVNMNEIFVEQVNMMPNMLGKKGWTVLSFHAPYHCAHCNTDIAAVLQPAQVKWQGELPIAPAFVCRKCSKPLAFDWLEEEYFSFLKRA